MTTVVEHEEPRSVQSPEPISVAASERSAAASPCSPYRKSHIIQLVDDDDSDYEEGESSISHRSGSPSVRQATSPPSATPAALHPVSSLHDRFPHLTGIPEQSDTDVSETSRLPCDSQHQEDSLSRTFSQSKILPQDHYGEQSRRSKDGTMRSVSALASLPRQTGGISEVKYDLLVETQRGFFFGKKPYFSSSSLFPIDPKPWVNGWTGEESITDVTNTSPPVGWRWTWDQWRVDMGTFMIYTGDPECGHFVLSNGDVDSNGWQYASWFGFARLKRWLRLRRGRKEPDITRVRNQEGISYAQNTFNQRSIRSASARSRWHGTHPFFHSFVRQRWWIRERERERNSSDYLPDRPLARTGAALGKRSPDLHPDSGALFASRRTSYLRPQSTHSTNLRDKKTDASNPYDAQGNPADAAASGGGFTSQTNLPSTSSNSAGAMKPGRVHSLAMLLQLLRVKPTDHERLDCVSRFLDIPTVLDQEDGGAGGGGLIRGSGKLATDKQICTEAGREPQEGGDDDLPSQSVMSKEDHFTAYLAELVCLPAYLPSILQAFLMQESRYQCLRMIRAAADTIAGTSGLNPFVLEEASENLLVLSRPSRKDSRPPDLSKAYQFSRPTSSPSASSAKGVGSSQHPESSSTLHPPGPPATLSRSRIAPIRSSTSPFPLGEGARQSASRASLLRPASSSRFSVFSSHSHSFANFANQTMERQREMVAETLKEAVDEAMEHPVWRVGGVGRVSMGDFPDADSLED